MSRSRSESFSGICEHLLCRCGPLPRQLDHIRHVAVSFHVATQDLDPSTVGGQRYPWPGLQRAHMPVDVPRTDAPLELAILATQSRRESRPIVILVDRFDAVDALQRSDQQLGA